MSNIDYLIPQLRLHLGDISEPYRYMDTWLDASLVGAVKALMRWWDSKYLVGADGDVHRSSHGNFSAPEPPLIDAPDERPIVLMAAIIIKGGTLENSAWSLQSWRDSEISFSNLEGGRVRDKSLMRDWDELKSLLGGPRSRLARARRAPLRGYHQNPDERKLDEF